MSVATPDDGSNAVATLGELMLTPGKYAFSADFRLNTVDFEILKNNYTEERGYATYYYTNKYAAYLTISTDDAELKGAEPIYLTTEWQNVKYDLEVSKETDLGEISFALNNVIGFDIANLKLIQLTSYADEYTSDSAAPVVVVHEYIADGVNEYVRFSNVRVTGRHELH